MLESPKKKRQDWLTLIGEVGENNAVIAEIYQDGKISYKELSGLVGAKAAEKIELHLKKTIYGTI